MAARHDQLDQQLDEECSNVRAPAPSYVEQLLPDFPDDAHRGYDFDSSSSFDKSFDDLFAPPPSVLNPLPLHKALKNAQENGKAWLLINIQEKTLFDSHRLNRDVWKSESVLAVIEVHFSFWQRDRSDSEGKEFCQLYQIKTFPHICVLNARTGLYMHEWSITKFGNEFAAASEMLDFVEKHSSYNIDKSPGVNESPDHIEIIDVSDEESDDQSNAVSSSEKAGATQQLDDCLPNDFSIQSSKHNESINSVIYSQPNALLKALHEERLKRSDNQ